MTTDKINAVGANGQSLTLPEDALFVPMDVQALVAGDFGQPVVATETIIPFASGPEAPERESMPQPPSPFGPRASRPRGVHLHWAMPDGLTRGDAGAARSEPTAAGNPLLLRPLPDRWVIVRMVYFNLNPRVWILEADRGDIRDLAGWTDPGPLPVGTQKGTQGRRNFGPDRLNATAGGDPAWAATYDAVVGRFALHDDLAGVPPTATMSYLVVGWWSAPERDPLHGLPTYGYNRYPYLNRMASLGWTPPPRQTFTLPPWPRKTFVHGTLVGVAANGVSTDIKPSPDRLELALGGTSFSAFAALLAEGTDAERDASERLTAAFTAGLLPRIDTPDGLASVDEERHGSAFVAVSEGTGDPDRIAEGDPFQTGTTPEPSAQAAAEPPPPTWRNATLLSRDEFAVRSAALARSAPALLTEPRCYRDVPTSLPRAWTPGDLSLIVRGAGRSFRHGGDGRFTADRRLTCRLANELVFEAAGISSADLPAPLRFINSYATPTPEADWLLQEAVMADPYRAAEREQWRDAAVTVDPEQITRERAEQLLRFPTSGSPLAPGPDGAPVAVLAATGGYSYYGSMIGMVCWSQAWVPLWLDWELELHVDEDLSRWRLGPVDLEAVSALDGDERIVVRGRALLTASTGTAFASQVRAWLEDERMRDEAGRGQATEETEAALATAATAADVLDVLTCSLRGVREVLLGLDPYRALITHVDADGTPTQLPPAKGGPRLLPGGGVIVRRLRVIDAFGRFVDAPPANLASLEVASTHRHPSGAPNFTLAPRFQAPARLALRLIDPQTPDEAAPVEARVDQEHPDQAVSPVAGWLLADHVDEALECFDAAGRPLGQLMHDEVTGAVVWEGAPGRPGPIAGPPDPGDDPGARHVARFAAGLVAADATARNDPAAPPDRESALSALLRGIDTTLWTVDPLGSVGTGAVAGLVGRPIAVVRAILRLDVRSDVDRLTYPSDRARDARVAAFERLAGHAVTVRLGELTRSDDALLAYIVDDDYSQARLVAPEVRSAALAAGRLRGQLGVLGSREQILPTPDEIIHPYVAGRTDVAVHPGYDVRLTLLMHPGGQVHVTSGLLPRKAIALQRDWFHEALEKLSPSFRVGPVLVDPSGVRMPRVTGLGERQAFTRRTTPLTWRDDPILASSQTALLPDDPAGLQEGWIRVVPDAEEEEVGAP